MNIFTRVENQEYERAEKILQCLRAHQSAVDTFLPLKNKQAAFEARLEELIKLISHKVPTGKGATAQKKESKKAVGAFYEEVCAVARAFALSIGNSNAAANLRCTKRKITGMKDGNVIPTIHAINKIIEKELLPLPDFAPYGISPATLSSGLALASAFDKLIGARAVINTQKSTSDKAAVTLLHQINTDLEIMSLLILRFSTGNINFVNAFHAANKIAHFGIRHTLVKGLVTLNGNPVHGALISCPATKKQTRSNPLGEYTSPKMHPGMREFLCTITGHPQQSKIIKVTRGKTVEANWEF